MRKYTCTASFTNTRIKPRSIVVEAETKKAARRSARSTFAVLHPAWEIAHVTATCAGAADAEREPVPGVELAVEAEPVDPAVKAINKQAADVATMLHKRASGPWWEVYLAEKARLLEIEADVAEIIADIQAGEEILVGITL